MSKPRKLTDTVADALSQIGHRIDKLVARRRGVEKRDESAPLRVPT